MPGMQKEFINIYCLHPKIVGWMEKPVQTFSGLLSLTEEVPQWMYIFCSSAMRSLQLTGCPWTPAWGGDMLLERGGLRKSGFRGMLCCQKILIEMGVPCPTCSTVWVSSIFWVVSWTRAEAFISNSTVYSYLNPLLIIVFLLQGYH